MGKSKELFANYKGEKSYVGMLVCPICQEAFEILLDRRLRNTIPKYSISPTNICDKCKDKYLKDGVLLINRETCSCMVISDRLFGKMFGAIPEHRIAFCDRELLETLDKKFKEVMGNEKGNSENNTDAHSNKG